jgi:ABC-2 type transport system ATP-binding protein
MNRAFVELVEVTKDFRSHWTFRATRAVDRLSVSITEAEIFGLIGHNGAGKTTTFKMLVGLIRPTRGRLVWRGCGQRMLPAIGFSPEHPYFYDHLTVSETLNFYGQLYGMTAEARQRRIADLLDQFRIGHKRDAPMRTLSKGTLQRVAVAQAIMHQPRFVVLDEPMSGLDPAGRKEMRDLIVSMKRSGTTIIFSSHILSDAEALCDRVGILAGGRLQEIVSIDHATAPPDAYTLVVIDASFGVLESLSRIAAVPPHGGPDRWSVRLPNQMAVKAALAVLSGSDATVEAIVPERPSLEQRFLRCAATETNGD